MRTIETTTRRRFGTGLLATAGLLAAARPARSAPPDTILNVSYDIARELFAQINPAFAAAWKTRTGQDIKVDQSHGGSSRQARAVLEGLQADVVTFNQVLDVQVLHDRGKLIPADWQNRLPHDSSPYYSLPAFLVRKGNPKAVQRLGRPHPGRSPGPVPEPEDLRQRPLHLSRGLRLRPGAERGRRGQAEESVKKLLANVPVFDTGGRGATTTFVEREIGDVLISFEAEVNAIRREYGC
jgi:sulfate transport system substrate-binding protein